MGYLPGRLSKHMSSISLMIGHAARKARQDAAEISTRDDLQQPWKDLAVAQAEFRAAVLEECAKMASRTFRKDANSE